MRLFPLPVLRRASSLFLSMSCLAFLAACGGADEEDLGDFFTIAGDPGGSGTLGSYFMASITDEWRAAAASFRENSARFRLQDGTFLNGTVFANPLQSSRVDYAHAVGLTGAGEVIAVVDEGFRRSHEVFAGKTNTTTGGPLVEDHGTTVASIAAGNSGTMVGVAPGADLIFSSWDDVDLAAAANEATRRGAVAQNNSWGFPGYYATLANYNSLIADPDAAAWLTALDTYAATGVVVFAISNTTAATQGELLEALPLFRPSLLSGWIAVGNSIPVFDDAGVSAVGKRVSAPCLAAAQWCMMADGYWVGATAANNGSYGEGTGSSYAAPQVAGALALLAEAFPALNPHQLRTRLLASADNSFTGFVSAGTVDLLDGTDIFNHNYSTEFGHGFLDIRAALLPIGPTSLAVGDGQTIETKDYGFSTGGALGDAVTRSLDGIDLTVSDALGGDFDVAAKAFATEAAPGALAETLAARSFGKDYAATRRAPLNPMADTFAVHPGQTLELNAPDGMIRSALLIGGSDDYGLALSRTVTEGDLRLDLGVKLARDSGSLMGFSGSGDTGGANMAALTVALSNDGGDGGFFALSGEMGIADLGTPTAISTVSVARFNSLRLDLGSRSVFSGEDRLTLGISMPIAVTSGSANMIVPVSLAEGGTEVRAVDINLAPEERQMEVSISYQMPMSEQSEFLMEVVHAENYGNVMGATDSAAVIGMKWSF